MQPGLSVDRSGGDRDRTTVQATAVVDGCQAIILPYYVAVVCIYVIELAAHRIAPIFDQQLDHIHEIDADPVLRVDHLVG